MKNSFVSFTIQVISLVVGFLTRKILLDYLGTEVMGLNSTAQSLLGFLNLAELGIGGAVAFTLYKPLFEDDKATVREIVALQGWLYKWVGLVVIAGSAIMMLFFPAIFSKMELPMWYAYASFGVLLYGNILGYFINYKTIVVSADQKDYKLQLRINTLNILKYVVQVLAVRYTHNGYVWWLVVEALFSTLTSLVVNLIIKKGYPYLLESVPDVRNLHKKYPEVTKKVSQVFFHKIGGFALAQTSPIIIYAYASLTAVTLYTNYNTVSGKMSLLFGALFTGMSAIVGNMLAEGDKKLIMKVFRELFTSRFAITAICCICMWFLYDPFICVWLGPEYLLDKTTLFMIIALFFVSNIRVVVESFKEGSGLFGDIWAPLVEAAINIFASIVLGKYYGLPGILGGVLLSQILVIMIWKPVYLFHWGLKEPVWSYVKLFFEHMVVGTVTFIIVNWLARFISIDPAANIWHFFLYAIILLVITSVLTVGILYAIEPGMRGFFKRIRASIQS